MSKLVKNVIVNDFKWREFEFERPFWTFLSRKKETERETHTERERERERSQKLLFQVTSIDNQLIDHMLHGTKERKKKRKKKER